MLAAIVLALLLVNLATMLVWHHDKARAIAGGRRVREADLLGLAMIGGTPGAFLARHLFRHKTRKQPFSTSLMLVAVVQVGAAIGFALPR